MKYLYIEPEVAGGLGEHTVIDRRVHPPIIKHLHYKIEGWLGDVILESFPAFIVTEDAKKALLGIGVTGAFFDDVEVSVTDQFEELYPDILLPSFVWLKPEGQPGRDDVGVALDGRLVISQTVLNVLSNLGASNALLEPFVEGH